LLTSLLTVFVNFTYLFINLFIDDLDDQDNFEAEYNFRFQDEDGGKVNHSPVY